MANVKNKDEMIAAPDAALEVAIASLIAADNSTTRVDALRLLTRRVVKANTGNRTRVRTAAST
jgi:hypothetical protein